MGLNSERVTSNLRIAFYKRMIPKKYIFSFLILWLALLDLFVFFNSSLQPLRIVVAGSFALFVPGWSILASIRRHFSFGLVDSLYSLGLSLMFYIFGGLALNTIGPLLGNFHPLSEATILLSFNTVLVIFWLFLYPKLELKNDLPSVIINRTNVFIAAFAAMLPLLSLAGSTILNNEGGNYVTIGMLLGVAITIIVITTMRARVHEWAYALTIYCISLALLLMYSMRSWHIIGWDVNLEYQVFQLTEYFQHWSMANSPGSEYNACLSITILPTILHSLVGGDSEYLFKFFIQVAFAAVPVAVYLLCRKYVGPTAAFFGAIIYAGQAWFIEQMPALIRQEVAFVFLATALLTLFDESLPPKIRKILFAIFSFGIVLSHYSTTYVWLAMLLICLTTLVILKIFIPWILTFQTRIDYRVIFLTLIFSFLWYAQITSTSNNTKNFFQNTFIHMSEIFSKESILGGFEKISFRNANVNIQSNLQSDYQQVYKNYRNNGDSAKLYQNTETYMPVLVDDGRYAPMLLPKSVGSVILTVSKFVKLFIVNVFSLLGIGVLGALCVYQYKRNEKDFSLDYLLLCLSTLPLVVIIIFLPYIQEKYNLTRLFMQVFIMLSLPTVLGLFWSAGWLHRNLRYMFITILTIVFLFYSTGLTQQFAGDLARITLQQPGGKYDSYYTYSTEIAAARWLAKENREGSPVYADVIAGLRLKGFSNFHNVNGDLFPTTIYINSYVYLSHTNIYRNTAYRFFKGDTLTYSAPLDFLEGEKNKIYSNNGSEIYR